MTATNGGRGNVTPHREMTTTFPHLCRIHLRLTSAFVSLSKKLFCVSRDACNKLSMCSCSRGGRAVGGPREWKTKHCRRGTLELFALQCESAAARRVGRLRHCRIISFLPGFPGWCIIPLALPPSRIRHRAANNKRVNSSGNKERYKIW